LQEAEVYTVQIYSIEQPAEMTQRCVLLVLISLAGTILSCLLLGFGPYWKQAAVASVIVFAFSDDFLAGGNLTTIFPKLSWR
jgi:hypothetical protein